MKKILLTIILGMFLISFTSAFTHQQNTILNLKITCLNDGYCSNSSFCNINIIDPNSNLNITGQNMTNQISFHNYTITPTELGEYCVSGFCEDGTYSEEIDFCFDVTLDGKELSLSNSLIRIFLIIFFVLLFLGYYKLNDKIDYEKWYDGILKKYENRNYIKLVLSSIGFNLIRNKTSNYYFIGLPIIMLIQETALNYNIGTFSLLFENLLAVYMLGVIMVAFLLVGQAQEFIIGLFDDINKDSWGIK